MRQLDDGLWEMPSGKTILIGKAHQFVGMLGKWIPADQRELFGCQAFTVDKERAFSLLHRSLKRRVEEKKKREECYQTSTQCEAD